MKTFRYTITNLLAVALLAWLLVQLASTLQSPSPSASMRGTLSIGAEAYYPYQYEPSESDGRLTGLSIELVRQACARAGYQVNFVRRDWLTLLTQLRQGELEAVCLSFRSPDREAFALFSHAYLNLRYAAFFRLDRYADLPRSPQDLRSLALKDRWRIGYTRGHAYPPELQAIMDQPEVRARAVVSSEEEDNLDRLINGEVDVIFCDHLAGTSYVMKNRWGSEMGARELDLPLRPTHIMYSKKVANPEAVERVNLAIDSMIADGTSAAIVRAYHYPLLLSLLEHNFLFDPISVLASAAAAISGIFLARKEGYNLLGAFLLAAAPAAGGGLLRDLVAGRRPVAVVADPSILITVLALVLAGFLVFRALDRYWPERARALQQSDVDSTPVLVFFDALGLACFTVIGVVVAMQWRCEPLWLWGPLLAATTNGGGSILRDILRHQPNHSLRTTALYVEISILWGLALSLFLIYYSGLPSHQVTPLQVAMLITVLGVGMTRFICLKYKINGLRY